MNEMNDPLVEALDDLACTGLARGRFDVYRFCMSAVGFLLLDSVRYRPMAEAVLDGCRHYLARRP